MKNKRIDMMEDYILTENSVSLDALCNIFKVSKNTIRRDINELVKRGNIRKVYGGVTSNQSEPIPPLLPFDQRNICYSQEKDAICRKAAQWIEDEDTVFIDSGITCPKLIEYLTHHTVTVLTNSLHICMKAIPYSNLTVITLPGVLKRETLSLVGNEAIE